MKRNEDPALVSFPRSVKAVLALVPSLELDFFIFFYFAWIDTVSTFIDSYLLRRATCVLWRILHMRKDGNF